jgi:xylan 1,4-beta-xylosidase
VYSSYTAAVFARKLDLAKKYDVNLEGAVTWAFTFADQPYFAGFRQLATQGIDLPILNVFRMYGKMGGEQVAAVSSAETPLDEIVKDGVRQAPDVGSLATLDHNKLAVMVWHYHDDDVPGPSAAVTLHLANIPVTSGEAKLTEFRIDADHSNSFTVWQEMGSPQNPTESQVRRLEKAGQLEKVKEQPAQIEVKNGLATIETKLPRQGVSLFVVEW